MTVLVTGASGATGRLVVGELLQRGAQVKIIVRSAINLPEGLDDHESLTIIKAAILDLSDAELVQHTRDCEAVVSCLGHNISFKGLYGQPRKLVRDATARLCQAIRENQPGKPVKYILMNTTGNRNRDLNESISLPERLVMGLVRLLLPPQSDNELAADFLRVGLGQDDDQIEWVTVRPDGLTNEETVTDYEIHPSPIRSPIFDAGQTSRSNVANFMAELITDGELWLKWKGQMPVIYNKE